MQESQVKALDGPPDGVTAHGTDGDASWPAPAMLVRCDKVARPKMNTGIMAHEYQDSPAVLAEKVKMLAGM
eukprot:5451382-Prymnesium_polylepis.1